MSLTDLPPTLNLDVTRERRTGVGEVVYGPGKTVDEVVAAARGLHAAHGRVLVTRASHALSALVQALPEGQAFSRSGIFRVGGHPPLAIPLAVLSAGTADEAVAEECAATAEFLGLSVERIRDCGVAGLHRLLEALPRVRACRIAIAIAGMEGALPSVLAGLVDLPLIAVPTSVGYGVAEGGRTALHAMLTSCGSGLVVVNIDNGFGAAMHAAAIARSLRRAG
jgi:NCAIR mutase (PurE)-related protein